MAMSFTCPKCRQKNAMSSSMGTAQKVRCANCQTTIAIKTKTETRADIEKSTAAKPIQMVCPSCMDNLEFGAESAGKAVNCYRCQQRLFVPYANVSEQPPTPMTGILDAKPALPAKANSNAMQPPLPKPKTPPPIPALNANRRSNQRMEPITLADDDESDFPQFLHWLGPAILAICLVTIIARDALSDLAKKVEVTVVEEKADRNDSDIVPVVFQANVEEEPDEQIKATTPVVFHEIVDEPVERTGNASSPVKVVIEDEPDEFGRTGKDNGSLAPIDPEPRIRYDCNFGLRYGMTALRDRDGRFLNKRITFSRDGGTSNTRIKINGMDMDYGGDRRGVIQQNQRRLPDDPNAEVFNRSQSTYQISGLNIHQFLEIVPSKQPVTVNGQPRRLLDTVRVRYVIENVGNQNVRFGLRSQVDTLIGGNDGVPFTVPKHGLITTWANFLRKEQIPEFLQALEIPNLQNPGTVAHMTIKLGGSIEPPSQVLLTHWPGGGAPWNVRVSNLSGDSAVVLYWPEKMIKPNERREIGFAYGLGGVEADQGQGKLGFTVDGDFEPGKTFLVTAYLNNPTQGQTATLEVADGLAVVGPETIKVPNPPVGQRTSIVTWQTKVIRAGKFRIQVRTNNGLVQAKTISIIPQTGGEVTVDLKGNFEPGKTFQVLATLANPLADETLALKLPDGLTLRQETGPKKSLGESTKLDYRWTVAVEKPGVFPVQVVSSTGTIHTKKLTIVRPEEDAGRFEMDLLGQFRPQSTFIVQATVASPVPGQTLQLELPSGLQLTKGENPVVLASLPAIRGQIVVQWHVFVERADKYSIRVKSSTGVARRKTLSIGKNSDNRGHFDFVLAGDFAPGKVFSVKATIPSPIAGQRLKIILPEDLQIVDAEPLTDAVIKPGQETTFSWNVRVQQPGRFPIRIESTTGLVRTKTLNLRVQERDKGIFGGN